MGRQLSEDELRERIAYAGKRAMESHQADRESQAWIERVAQLEQELAQFIGPEQAASVAEQSLTRNA